MVFKVIINKSKVKFSACHFLKEHYKCSRLHGHNYYVSVEVTGDLNKDYFVLDFMELSQNLEKIIKPMDHFILIPTKDEDIKINKEKMGYVKISTQEKRYILPESDICFLPIEATTSELLAKYIHRKLKEIYNDKKFIVKVGESKSSMASYEE